MSKITVEGFVCPPGTYIRTAGKSLVRVPEFPVLDMQGVPLSVGDTIATSVTVYRSSALRISKIIGFVEQSYELIDGGHNYPTDAVSYTLKCENAKFSKTGGEVVKIA